MEKEKQVVCGGGNVPVCVYVWSVCVGYGGEGNVPAFVCVCGLCVLGMWGGG